MKTIPRLLITLASLALMPAAFAQQQATAPAKPAKSDRVLRAEAKLNALTQPPPTAADALDAAPPAAIDLHDWRLENAQKLLQTGLWFKQQGETALAADAASKALALLAAFDGAINPATQPELAARRNEIAGLIQEQLVGNAAAARQSYEAAKQVSPGSAMTAGNRLKRLDKAEGRPDKPANNDKTPKTPKG